MSSGLSVNHTLTPVVVLRGVESASHGALGIVRTLGRLGVPVYVIASHSPTPAEFSRYSRGKHVCDLDSEDPQIPLAVIIDVGIKLGGRPILIPADDTATLFVADHSSELQRWFRFPQPSAHLIRDISSKKGMYFLARQHGVPTPEAAFPVSRKEVLQFLDRAKFPIVLKAIYGGRLMKASGYKMFIVKNRSELLDRYDEAEDPLNPNLMMQEYIPGADDTIWMFNGYFSADSECLLSFTGKKIRQYPVSQGSTSLGICLENQSVRNTTIEFMKKIGYRGILDVGFRYDARDAVYKLLDVNPRIGSTFRLFTAENGMDVARALYFDMTGQPVPSGHARQGRKWVVEDQDLISSWQYHRSGQLPFRTWLRSFRGVDEAAYYAADDLYPCFMRAVALCGHVLKRKNPAKNGTSEKPGLATRAATGDFA